MKISKMVENTMSRWALEAELNFAIQGSKGVKMHREVWANGKTMVGWEGARANQFVPLETAIKIYRNGWKVYR